MRRKLIGEFGARLRRHKEVAARDVDLVFQGEGDRVAGGGALQAAIEAHQLLDARLAPGAHYHQRVAGRYRTRDNGTGKTAEVEIRPVDPLHRKTKGLLAGRLADIDRLKIVEE